MEKKYKIAILGIGGVGGFLGAKLAFAYSKSDHYEIVFITRGENGCVIGSKGIRIITPQEDQTVFPNVVTENIECIRNIDLLILCIKSYDLESTLININPYLNKKTILLTILNGIEHLSIIRKITKFPIIFDGCIYLSSRLIKPGVVKLNGNLNELYFGGNESNTGEVEKVSRILNNAGINSYFKEDITLVIWQKYFLISTIGTLTTYLDQSIGAILSTETHMKLLQELMTELINIAASNNIKLPSDVINKTISKLSKMPYDTTSSLHTDFKAGNKTELDSITGYVIRLAKQLSISTPTYEKMYNHLFSKQKPIL